MKIEHLIIAIELIKNNPEDTGSVKCPACGKNLEFIKSKRNGHVSAKCETVNCLEFRE